MSRPPTERGQILIIFVFAIIGLVGVTGLAIDGGNIYSDRRRAQNAADSAALQASVVRVNWEKKYQTYCTGFNTVDPLLPACSADIINKARDIAQANGYDNNPAHGNRVDVYNPPIDGPYASCVAPCNPQDYIEVIIHTDVDTFFAKVLGIRQLHNTVQTVTLARFVPQQDLYGGASLVQLYSHDCKAFDLGGNASLTLNGGGIVINSDSSCAFYQNPCKVFNLNDGAGLEGVGGISSACSPPPVISPVNPGYDFPPQPLITDTPAECSIAGSSTKVKGVTTWNPGHYTNIPSGKLASGVYCLDKIQTQNGDAVDGTAGVLIYVKPDASKFQIDGGTLNLVAMTSGPYANIVIYYYPGAVDNGCKINGGTVTTITGQVFIPYCNLTVNGNSTPTGLTTQIVAYKFTFTGNSVLTFNDAGGKVPVIPEVDQVGLFH